jgi:hypothetical protein
MEAGDITGAATIAEAVTTMAVIAGVIMVAIAGGTVGTAAVGQHSVLGSGLDIRAIITAAITGTQPIAIRHIGMPTHRPSTLSRRWFIARPRPERLLR